MGKKLSYIYMGLVICVISLVLVLIVGTVYGVFFKRAPQNSGHPGQGQIEALQNNLEGYRRGQAFTGIGQIRISTADPQPGIVILFVTFNYFPYDRAFSEELVHRVRDFRNIIVDYIGSFSAAELQAINEENIKTELLRRFNAVLRLGQIEVLFFSDFMIVG